MLTSEKVSALIFVASLALLFVAEASLLLGLIVAKARRQSIPTRWTAWLLHSLSAVCLICIAYAYWIEPYWIEVTHVTVRTQKLHGSSLRIVQFSDTHCDTKLRNENRLVELVNSARPDIIVFTGDSLNTPASLPTFKAMLARMQAKNGKYAVRGNFDCWFWGKLDLFSNTGFIELTNRSHMIDKDGQMVSISGVDCIDPEAYERILGKVPDDVFSIFLYHYPDLIEEVSQKNVDLYLAGHTHGGQVALPFYGAMVTLARHGKKYEAGRYDVGKTTLYVNRGIGMEAGYVPRVRFFARPEVTVIDIVPID
jgi:hypothetical protein